MSDVVKVIIHVFYTNIGFVVTSDFRFYAFFLVIN